MHAIKHCLLFGCLIGATLAAAAQDRKPGVYEVTLVTTTVSPTC